MCTHRSACDKDVSGDGWLVAAVHEPTQPAQQGCIAFGEDVLLCDSHLDTQPGVRNVLRRLGAYDLFHKQPQSGMRNCPCSIRDNNLGAQARGFNICLRQFEYALRWTSCHTV